MGRWMFSHSCHFVTPPNTLIVNTSQSIPTNRSNHSNQNMSKKPQRQHVVIAKTTRCDLNTRAIVEIELSEKRTKPSEKVNHENEKKLFTFLFLINNVYLCSRITKIRRLQYEH